MKVAFWFLVCLALAAQEGIPGSSALPVSPPALPTVPEPSAKFLVSFSHQPLEVFKAAFLAKLPSVAMYEALMCNVGDAPGNVSGGLVLQAANTKVSTINRGLIEITAQRARHKSKKYIAAEIAKWASLTGALLVSGGAIAAGREVAISLPIITLASDRLSKQFDQSVTSTSVLGSWLAADESYSLSSRSCTSRLFLGGWRGQFTPFSVEIK